MWSSLDTWIVLIASITAMACALPGTFLLLSRQSMMSHGIAHAVLPGIVLAHLVSGGQSTPTLLIGAVLAGILCALLTKGLQNFSGVESGAALGISFTTLFAIGLVLQRLLADHVHIEPSHVLWGNLEMAVFTKEIPPPAFTRALFLLLLNATFVGLFLKELTVATFDPQQGDSANTRPKLFFYALITLSAITCVIAFEVVGSILVVAMMIIPPAIATLLSKNLKSILLLALGFAVLSSLVGHFLSIGTLGKTFSTLLGLSADSTVGSTNTAGGIALTAGTLFLVVALLRKFRRSQKPSQKPA